MLFGKLLQKIGLCSKIIFFFFFAVKNLKTVKVQTPTIFISSEETKQFKLTNKILFRIQIELSICLLIKTMSMKVH